MGFLSGLWSTVSDGSNTQQNSNPNSNANRISNSTTTTCEEGKADHNRGAVTAHSRRRTRSRKTNNINSNSKSIGMTGEVSSSLSRAGAVTSAAAAGRLGLGTKQKSNSSCNSQQSYISDLEIGDLVDGCTKNNLSTEEECHPSADFTLASSSSNNNNSQNNNNEHNNNNNTKTKNSKNNNNECGGGGGGESGSSSSGSISYNTQNSHNRSVMMDKQRAEKVGRSGTRFVYVVLLITAVTLSVTTYFFVKQSEYNEFVSEFRSYARETADLAETNAENTISQLETLATTITSEGLLQRSSSSSTNRCGGRSRRRKRQRRQRSLFETEEEEEYDNNDNDNDCEEDNNIGSWPNVTIPHFDRRVEDLSKSAGVNMILYVPLIEPDQKDEWERYANYHSPWRKQEKDNKAQHSTTGSNNNNNNNNNGIFGDEDTLLGQIAANNINSQYNPTNELINRNTTTTYNNPEDDPNYKHIFRCSIHEVNETREGFVDLDSFMETVLEEKGGFDQPHQMVAPVYQYGGPGFQRSSSADDDDTYGSYIALMDLMTHPVFKKEVVASIEYDVPVISEHMDLSFLLDALSLANETDQNHNHHNRNEDITTTTTAESPSSSSEIPTTQEEDDDDEEPREVAEVCLLSLTLDPVKESFEPDARTVGFVVGVVPWSTFFRNVLQGIDRAEEDIDDDGKYSNDEISKNVNGIVVKVVSDCGSVFTYVLNSGGRDNWVQLGDWKEQYESYEYLNHTSRFFYKEHPKGLSRHCHYDLHIYPNEEFRQMYQSNDPLTYAMIVAVLFLLTGFLFACYDAFVFKRQRLIVNEATGMVVENARRAARNERELNDFIAHEVRNPLAAAMSACAFVSSAITEDNRTRARNDDDFDEEKGLEECTALISSDEKRREVQDDIKIIDSSLHFINDLLRNMLDMQRAGANQIPIENKPTDIMEDVFKPVQAMLHLRELPFEVVLECSCNSKDCDDDVQLFVMTDPLRLKQVILNLTRNAVKFVEKGFVRCGAKVNADDGLVELYVDDSGPGIPSEKRGQVFGKFQQSLDSLQQGTGIGLSLCKKLIDLMGGSLYIDENYRSGVEGCPGTRFVIQLKIPPLQLNNAILDSEMSRHEKARRLRQIVSSSKLSSSSSSSSVHIKRSLSSPSLAQATLDSTTDRPKNDTAYTAVEYTPSESSAETSLSFNENTPDLNAETTIDHRLNSVDDKKQEEQLSTKVANSAGHNVAVADNNGKKEEDENADGKQQHTCLLTELPENLSVLFVDDDMIVRKLFSRTLKKLNPSWTLQEASNGETAIEVITSAMQQLDDRVDLKQSDEENSSSFDDYNGFDLIFMDQYMASVQKQLLGTETVRAIRAKGIHRPIICGLSANDVEDAFLHAGSDAFMFKPFPCKQDVLKKELLRIMNIRSDKQQKRHSMF